MSASPNGLGVRVQPVRRGGGLCPLWAKSRTSLWEQLVWKTLHATGHRYLERGEIIPRRARLGCDHLGPKNEEGRDHDEHKGQLLAHCSFLSLKVAGTM